MRLLVVGAGSTGGYFGARLAEAGRDVSFLVRPGRAEQLRKDGLRIASPHGDMVLEPHLVTAGNINGAFDLVLLAVKAHALDAALDDLAPAIGPDTMILPVLNGMRHIDVLAARFGDRPVLGGVCRIATTIDEQGRIVQLSRIQELIHGERDGSLSGRIAGLDGFMQGAGFETRLSRTIEHDMWEKWVLLATLGGITCLMRGTVGDIASAPGGAVFVLGLLDECIAIARAAGQAPDDTAIAGMRTAMTAAGSTLTSSMYRDLEQKRPVEAEQILGDLLVRARSLGFAAPLIGAAYVHLSIYRNNISRAGGAP